MEINASTVELLVQGGALVILPLFGVGVYRLALRVLNVFQGVMNNHFTHMTEEITGLREDVQEGMKEVSQSVDRMADRLEGFLAGRR